MKLLKIAAVLAVVVVLGQVTAAPPARANDYMFPAAPAARAAIDFDSRGFLIHGKRTFLVSAGMEYARVPRALWRDRLLRFKRAGFNCVEMYTFWNWHEPQEGKFDFSGDHDLNAYLKLVKQMGMYAICRVGPYYCAEWDLGGYPLWLKFKPGVRVREDNPQFEAAVDQFFDRLIPIVAANQINRGGSVVLVQLENEHPQGWGTDMPNGYFRHLRDKAVALGLQVPYFFSGVHHGSDPGNDGDFDDADRPNPWMSTEFWSVWYSVYGGTPADAATYARRTWKIIAGGGSGYNYYMAHGGSNFGYTNNNEDAASYDYGAAVGQGGDLRPTYYQFKRAAWFARSFQDILENSHNATADFLYAATNRDVQATARRSPAGTILFLDNPGKTTLQTQAHGANGNIYPTAGPITLAPGEIMPVVMDALLTPHISLTMAAAHVLGVVRQGETTTLVVYGSPGESGELLLKAGNSAQDVPIAFKAGDWWMQRRISSGAGDSVRILAVNDTLADRTWFVDAGGQTYIVCGPAYVGDTSISKGRLQIEAERPWQEGEDLPVIAFGAGDAPLRLTPPRPSPQAEKGAPATHGAALALGPWQVRNASEAAAPGYDDHAWLSSESPLQMGADGDLTADAWYRTTIDVPAAGNYMFHTEGGGDRAIAFVDGKRAGSGPIRGRGFLLDLPAGRHLLAIFTAHDGRDKLVGHLGPIDTIDAKGLRGKAYLQAAAEGQAAAPGSATTLSQPDIPVTGWRMRGGPGDPNASTGWRRLAPGATFEGPEFFRTQFTTAPPGKTEAHPIWRVVSRGLGHGSVWVNGHNLGRYPEKIPINGLYIPECWLKRGVNTLVVYDEDGMRPALISVAAEPAASRDVEIFTASASASPGTGDR